MNTQARIQIQACHIAGTFVNGNRSDAVQALQDAPSLESAALALTVASLLGKEDRASFLRAIFYRLD